MPAARKKKESAEFYSQIFNLVIVPLSVGVFYLANAAYRAADTLATKPYVDDRFAASKVYTDEKAAQVLKDAFEHSDRNRAEVVLRMQEMASKQNEALALVATGLATNATKTDLMMRSLQAMRDDAWKSARKK